MSDTHITLTDLNGREVYSTVNKDRVNVHVQLSLPRLHGGIYLLKAKNESGIMVEKVVVQ
ncbi:T9SS type A sorting domain-containing protein [Cytophagaceae bacterium ABcell3]|nr:T9SS type A sorting domain-containing protein [Cytophagaceae bacterium ABcell3]